MPTFNGSAVRFVPLVTVSAEYAKEFHAMAPAAVLVGARIRQVNVRCSPGKSTVAPKSNLSAVTEVI